MRWKTRKPGERVMTCYGPGTIQEYKEFYSRLKGGIYRYEVLLDSNPLSFPRIAFFQDEIHDVPFVSH